MPSISMKELLEAGVHFGHQTKRWNPKMKEYIFGERNGIYIIDLQKTLKLFKDAMRYVGRSGRAARPSCSSAPSGRRRRPSPKKPRAAVSTMSISAGWAACSPTCPRCRSPSSGSKNSTSWRPKARYDGRAKKEVSRLERERKHLQQNLAGIKDMTRPARRAVRCRFQQGSHRREGSAQAGHSGGRGRRYQLRSR